MKRRWLEREAMEKLCAVCAPVSFAMIVLYFLDIILLGTGNLTRIGGISTRILFFGLAGLTSLPLLIVNFPRLLKNRYVLCVAVFLVWAAVCAVRGILAGNRMDIIQSDVFGYLNFCLLPTMLCVLNATERKTFLMKCVVAAGCVLAVITIILSYYSFLPYRQTIYNFMQDSGLCGITVMDGITSRVFFHTASRYFFVAYAFMMYFLYRSDSRRKSAGHILIMALLMVGIFLSYSRAIYVGSVVAVLAVLGVLLVHRDRLVKRMVCAVLASAMVMVLIVGTISLTQRSNLLETAIFRVALSFEPIDEEIEPTEGPDASQSPEDSEQEDPFDEDQEDDDFTALDEEMEGINIRTVKMELLGQSIRKNPVFGNGLGAAIDFDDGYVEYTYQDILNKMGIVGLVLFLSPFALLSWAVIVRRRREKDFTQRKLGMYEIASYSTVIYFLFITYFNPSMNTTVGIATYLFAIAMVSGEDRRLKCAGGEKKT